MIDQDDLLASFVEESRQHLQTVEPDLLQIEESGDRADSEILNRVFRSIHSIKGASGFFGLQQISKLSHLMENILSMLRNGKLGPNSEMTDALLSGLDALKAMVDDIGASEEFDISNEMSGLQHILDSGGATGRKVAISETGVREADESDLTIFNVSEDDLNHFTIRGYHFYAVKIFLKEDLTKKGKTPFDFINNMVALGQYLDSHLDVTSISGLADCLDNDLAFRFLFATVLAPDLVPKGLELPDERIRHIDLGEFRETIREKPGKETDSEMKPGTQQSEVEVAGNETALPENDSEDQTEKFQSRIQPEEKIRVGVNFLNDLVNLAGELVLGRNQLMQTALPLVKDTPGLNPVLQHISRVTSEIQEKIMHMRMQPISLVFGKFQRVVRSLAKNVEKDVRLVTEGKDVELDKTIIEGLSDPLTHLIRNAIDHGMESPKEREAAGKPRHGTIELRAYYQGGQVNLEVIDDGRGIDGEAVAKRALEFGFATREQIGLMTEKEKIRLVFHPGFSTAAKVTDLSGRGVGMDVVITNIEQLGGTVSIDTEKGRGTKITLVLPLTLAIVSGLLINAGGQYFILPEVDIDELVRVKPDEIAHRINRVGDAPVLRLRDMLLPLVDLNILLGMSDGSEGLPCLSSETDRDRPLRIIVLKHGTSGFGLIVDAILSMEEIVVKSLPRYLKKMKCFSGVSILGNGTVSLILDVPGIVRKAAIERIRTDGEDAMKSEPAKAVETEEQTLLLFENGGEERFAMPLELISRIEQVPAARIETIKDMRFLQYHDLKLRLIFLEDFLPVGRPDRPSDGSIGVIIPRNMKYPAGIVIDHVVNTVKSAVTLDTESVMAPGLFGSAVIDGRITLFPDIYHIIDMAAPEWHGETKCKRERANNYKVLLADDTPFFRMVETEYLVSAGYDVVQAENGEKAMRILEEQDVDAAILDITMPVMTGWDVIRAIRSDSRLKSLPVMALTSLGDEAVIRRGLDAGFNDWDTKLDKTRMLEKLSRLLG